MKPFIFLPKYQQKIYAWKNERARSLASQNHHKSKFIKEVRVPSG